MENDSLVLWGLLAMLVLSVFSLFAVYNIESGVSEQELNEAIAKNKVSAQEIADLVVIPEIKEFDVPEFKGEEMVSDLWNDLYSVQIAELEGYAYNDSFDELSDDEYEGLEDWLKINLEGFDEFESDVEVEDYDVEVVELGLEEDEDKSAKVGFELEFEYSLVSGPNHHEYDGVVFVTADVSYDEGDYSEEDVKLVYSFE